MPLVSEMRHPKSLDFAGERKVMMLRAAGEKWESIRSRVRNLQGHPPSVSLLKRVYRRFRTRAGRVVYKYKNCGRRATVVTPQVERFLIARLKALRTRCVCTSATLRRELIAAMGVDLHTATIRKVLRRRGFFWLPRAQKRKFSEKHRKQRMRFAQDVLDLSKRQLRDKLAFSMDGVVLSLPPSAAIDRANYCAHGDSHMWRQKGEAASPALAGADPYPAQLPQSGRFRCGVACRKMASPWSAFTHAGS